MDYKKQTQKANEFVKKHPIVTIIIVAVLAIIVVNAAADTNEPVRPESQPESVQSVNNTADQTQEAVISQLSEDEQLKKIVSDKLSGNNNLGKPYLRNVRVVKQASGGWGVFSEYNADDNFGANMIKGSIELKMSEIYIALYTSGKDVKAASVAAYFPLEDKYGNSEDGVVYKSNLGKDEADKVNWNANESSLKVSILPSVWTTAFLHTEFR